MTVPDTDTISDHHFAMEDQSIAVLRKRDGAEISVAGAAPSDLARSGLVTVDINE